MGVAWRMRKRSVNGVEEASMWNACIYASVRGGMGGQRAHDDRT